MKNPFHEGELKVQKLAGEERTAAGNGTIVADNIMRGAWAFLAQQPMAVFGSRDAQDRLWASMLFGSRGFMTSVDGLSVNFDLALVSVQDGDPFWQNIETNPTVGLITIELGTRRRIRINGEIERLAEANLKLHVKEAYPNCPKYITRRVLKTVVTGMPQSNENHGGEVIDSERRQLIERGDALFIASAHPTRGADASHRGGNPGFIEVLDESTIRIPDYPGNSMFNTFGNLVVNPSAGIVIPDFEHGLVLQLTGKAEPLFDVDDPMDATGGTGRFLIFHVSEWLQRALPADVESELLDYSPFNPKVVEERE